MTDLLLSHIQRVLSDMTLFNKVRWRDLVSARIAAHLGVCPTIVEVYVGLGLPALPGTIAGDVWFCGEREGLRWSFLVIEGRRVNRGGKCTVPSLAHHRNHTASIYSNSPGEGGHDCRESGRVKGMMAENGCRTRRESKVRIDRGKCDHVDGTIRWTSVALTRSLVASP